MKTVLAGILLLATVATGVALLSFDGVIGVLAPMAFPEDTRYAQGYSPGAFRQVHRGDSEERVASLLGAPLQIANVYHSGPCDIVWVAAGSVTDVFPTACPIHRGAPSTAVTTLLGRAP